MDWSRAEVRVNLRALVEDAVETGIAYGWSQAHKHDAQPSPEIVKQKIYDAVMSDLAEVIHFGDSSDAL